MAGMPSGPAAEHLSFAKASRTLMMSTLTADGLAGHDCTPVENELESSGIEKLLLNSLLRVVQISTGHVTSVVDDVSSVI